MYDAAKIIDDAYRSLRWPSYQKRDLQQHYRDELADYEEHTSMTEEERAALHQWVESGHSVYENPDMVCWDGGYPVEFLTVYRWAVEEAAEAKDAAAGFGPPDEEQFCDEQPCVDPDSAIPDEELAPFIDEDLLSW